MQLILFGLALGFYYIFHSFLANNNVKNFLMEHWISQKYYRLLFNFFAIILLLPIYYFYQKIETSFLFENVLLQNVGLGMAVVGVLLLLFALSQYNLSEFAGTQQFKKAALPKPESLKVSGFNSIVRHPLYFSMLIIFWGGFLFRPTELILIICLVSTVYLFFGTKLEEEKLVEEFGESYLIYQKQVGMLVPFFK